MKISYLGKELETTFYKEISDKEYNEIINQLYAKPDIELVKQQIRNLYFQEQIKNNLITDYFFKDLMWDTKVYYNKRSIGEMLGSKELVGSFIKKTEMNDKVYPPDKPLVDNFKTALRLGGKGVASQVSNFPLDVADMILNNFNTNDNYYDFSCGWGVRLTSAMKHDINYYGTDPNYLLVNRLNDYATLFKQETFTKSNVKIYCQGSEKFIPELENKIGLAFSSPPYFYLEDYKYGDQSWKQGTTYEQRKTNYLKPTLQNIYIYMTDNAYLCFNINNFDKYMLAQDTKEIAENVGFKLIDCIRLDNIERVNSNSNFNDNSEKIMIFVKPNHPRYKTEHDFNEITKLGQMSLFD